MHDKFNLRLFHADSWIFAHVAVYQAHTALILGLLHASDTTVPDGQLPMQLLGRQLLILETATLLVACTYALAALNLRLFHTDSWTCAQVAAHRLIQPSPWAECMHTRNSIKPSYLTLLYFIFICQCNHCLMCISVSQAVLAAVNHNNAAADLLLREMEQHQAPSGSDSDEESANHIIPPETSAKEPAGEQQALSRSGQRQIPPPKTLKAPAPPATRASSKKCNKQSVDEGVAVEDVYYKYRKEALKLSRAWRKKLHQAANAFAGSHYSGETRLCPTLQLESGLSCLGIVVAPFLK